jgi:phosphomannomutase
LSADPDPLAAARAWLAEDPDPKTRAELAALISAAPTDPAAAADIAERFSGRLEFGTAGLRGALGAGPMRMNRVVVIRAAAGLAAYLKKRGGGAVVIGYDARHNSDVFARDTAEVMSGAGLAALVLPQPLPTPVLAFAIRHLGAAAGVMVTASHNPPQDNGYKVYLGDGTQIVPPADTEISAAIDAVGPLADVPRGDDWVTLDDGVLQAYLERVSSVVTIAPGPALRVAYTPLHGVGGEVVLAAFERAGLALPHVVPAQFAPDADFPTVAFPNPEEPGAMDLLLAVAKATDADLAIANDPDADRCAVAVRTATGFRPLRGDELGSVLGWWLAERAQRRGAPLQGRFANSIVSSSLLAKIAASFGLEHTETLTGFKWIGRLPELRFGYEEALGYCVDPSAVRDKDGISAALLIAELVSVLGAEGRRVDDVLDDLALEHGVHATDQLSIRVDDVKMIPQLMAKLRDNPPATLGGSAVRQLDDLTAGGNGLPPTDGLRFWLADGVRVIVRPSGTEPKLKCYVEVIVPATEDLEAARVAAAAKITALRTELTTLLTD